MGIIVPYSSIRVKHVTTTIYYFQLSHAECFNHNFRAALIATQSNCHSSWDNNLMWLQLEFKTA
jgi:hypothetical protein